MLFCVVLCCVFYCVANCLCFKILLKNINKKKKNMHCSNCLSHCSRSWYAVLAFTLTHSHYQVRRNAKICLSKLCSLAVDGGEELQSVLLEEFKALLRVQEVSIFYLLRLRKYLHCYGVGVKKCNSTRIGINETEYEEMNRVQRVPIIYFFLLVTTYEK